MTSKPMKHIHFTGRVLFIFCAAYFLQSCGGSESSPSDEVQGNYAINLFPNSNQSADNHADKLSFEAASAKSSFVFVSPHIKKIDSSYRQGAPVFYIYQAARGEIQKAPKSYHKNNKDTTFYFLSQEKLFTGGEVNDSVYLFLEPLADFKLLRSSMKIRYHWVANAPFERQQ